jgi:DNA-directed RNA polymerase subunit beta'
MKQLAGMRGLMTKPSGEIIETPIISNFKEGLSVLEYFNSTHGARKGLADTALKTANSGYLTRRLVDVAQDAIISEDDCGTDGGIKVQAVVDSGQVIVSLANRVLGRTAAEDIVDPNNRKTVLAKAGELIEERHAEAIEKAQVQEVRIRSVLTCDTVTGVCAKCYGRDLARGTPVNIGEAVGVIAAQSIGEPGTQLTMRTFHIGGTANVVDQSFIESNFNGKVKIKNRAVVKDSQGRVISMTRTMSIVILDQSGKELAVHKVPYGARVHVDEGDAVKRGTKLAQWDPYTRPILTEASGKVDFEDLIEGASVREQTDEMKGTTNRVIVDWRASPRSADLKPAIVVKDGKGKPIKVARGGDARYLLPVEAILSVEPGADVKAGDVLARIPTSSARSGDITGGLPRVAELFEARRPKDHAIIAEISGTIEFGKDYKNKQRISIKPDDANAESVEYLIPRGKSLAVQHGDRVERGDFVYDGHPAPHDILAIKGVEELANYLINEIQDVYRLQGVTINDKHIEVIVRQMLQKVEVTDPGDTDLIKSEQLDRIELEEKNAEIEKAGKKPATATPVLLGITKASLQTRSFISAASFQETTRVLTDAAVNGKIDTLEGLKENVIVGRLIPAGTGGALRRLRKIASKRDELIAREQAKVDAEKALAGPSATPVRRRRRTTEEAVE